MISVIEETKIDLLRDLGLPEDSTFGVLDQLSASESKYLKDLRINLKTALKAENLSEKEGYLLALAAAVNEKNDVLITSFEGLAQQKDATDQELAETAACVSLLSSNNVLYRFKHFLNKDSYHQLPARIKMNIMMSPALGKEFFELLSLAVSAINGCEQCVNSHEDSLRKLGTSEQRVFDAVRVVAVVVGLTKIIH